MATFAATSSEMMTVQMTKELRRRFPARLFMARLTVSRLLVRKLFSNEIGQVRAPGVTLIRHWGVLDPLRGNRRRNHH